MQIALLKEIISSIAGSQASGIANLLFKKKNVNEFLIAKKLKLTINQTRNILYKLAEEGLVSFIRKKDRKKGGWYTYFWTLNTGKSLHVLKNMILKKIDPIKTQINEKKFARFYCCPNCNMDYTEETALLNNFTCPECGEVMLLKDNASVIANLEKEIAKLEHALSIVNKEISEITSKEGKAMIRKVKAEAKKKAIERAKKKKAREKELAKKKKPKKLKRKPKSKNKPKAKKSRRKKR